METFTPDEVYTQSQDEVENNIILVDEIQYPTPDEEVGMDFEFLGPARNRRTFIQSDTSSEIQLVEDYSDFVVASLRRY